MFVFDEPLRKICYYGVENISAPSLNMTDRILRSDYGDNYFTNVKSKIQLGFNDDDRFFVRC